MANPVGPLESTPAQAAEPGPGPVPAPASGSLEHAPKPIRLPLRRGRGNAALNAAAERVGRTVGIAVETARELPARVAEVRERFMVVRARTREDAASAAAQWKGTAEQRLHQARDRAQRLANENPLHVIAGTAAAAFILGFVLRIWRSKNARS